MRTPRLVEPWLSFLEELDHRLIDAVDIHCIGGFVISQVYGLGRTTSDLDFVEAIPRARIIELERMAGRGSALARKHKVHLEFVGVATLPHSYESRLVRICRKWRRLKLRVLEPHDLALSKLERSAERDIQDVMHLASRGLIKREALLKRYEEELRPYLTGKTPIWNDSTLRMWVEACWPDSP